ncbi:hypothetical protein RFI_29855 [Reticulomyxa filosa]|uniref:Uncharacterized protein n=1 Tax=Reticulomyxa filosa TaxID=46433 RepID=X6M038_RETFI|nr:hypothetical protein RFI_29855 [Reticulomyxa filosa]|eukprot:ETO07538.1 hypothetical protein RFI_29855 [Reticulomyxa filosa]
MYFIISKQIWFYNSSLGTEITYLMSLFFFWQIMAVIDWNFLKKSKGPAQSFFFLPNKAGMEEIQKVHKQQTKEYLEKIQSSEAWKKLVATMHLKDVRMEVFSDRHYPEALTLLSFQFSMYGGTINHASFHVSAEENLARFKPLLRFAIETGTSLATVKVDTNRLVAITIMYDLLAKVPTEINSTFQLFRKEIINQSLLSLPSIKNNVFDTNMQPLPFVYVYMYIHIKYGEVQWLDVFAVDPFFKHQGIGIFNAFISTLLMYCIGYKQYLGVATNPASSLLMVTTTQKTNATLNYTIFDYSECELITKNDEHISRMSDVYNRLITKFGFTEKYVQQLKESSKMLVFLQDLQDYKWWTRVAEKNFFNSKAVVDQFVLSKMKTKSRAKL